MLNIIKFFIFHIEMILIFQNDYFIENQIGFPTAKSSLHYRVNLIWLSYFIITTITVIIIFHITDSALF
jgi:hypothetical protein